MQTPVSKDAVLVLVCVLKADYKSSNGGSGRDIRDDLG